MTINLTANIDTQIAAFKKQIADLEKQKKVLAEKEGCAERILLSVTDCVKELQTAGVAQEELEQWATVLYARITGKTPPGGTGDAETIKLQEELTEKTKSVTELQGTIKDLQSRVSELSNTTETDGSSAEPEPDATGIDLFLAKVHGKSERVLDKITWQDVQAIPFTADILKELEKTATTKSQKYIVDKLPQLCADYINGTNDQEEMSKLPNEFKPKVKALLKSKRRTTKSTAKGEPEEEQAPQETTTLNIEPGGFVEMKNPSSPNYGEIWKVVNETNGWVDVVKGSVTDSWKVEDVAVAAPKELATAGGGRGRRKAAA